jgi:[ribosomal protein S18]-alanine N-acetyltransferase
MQATAKPTILIRPLAGDPEARFCAEFIVASEPWVTLDFGFDQALQRLSDPTREIFVATVADQIVGVLILFLDGTLKGYIQTIAVHPRWRGQGIGTQLIGFAEQRIFRISPNVFLCVSSFNAGAQKLYAHLGYQRVGELPDFVMKGYSEILMRKTLGPLRDFQPVV